MRYIGGETPPPPADGQRSKRIIRHALRGKRWLKSELQRRVQEAGGADDVTDVISCGGAYELASFLVDLEDHIAAESAHTGHVDLDSRAATDPDWVPGFGPVPGSSLEDLG